MACCCKIDGAPPKPAALPTKAVAPDSIWVIALVPETFAFEAPCPIQVDREIYFFSDASPPNVADHPDLGRAPPVA